MEAQDTELPPMKYCQAACGSGYSAEVLPTSSGRKRRVAAGCPPPEVALRAFVNSVSPPGSGEVSVRQVVMWLALNLAASPGKLSMECPTYICNTENVIEALGYWPSFHDAEVISFSAARAAPGQAGKTSARLCVNVCQYKEVGAGTTEYEMVCCKSVLIEFLFVDLQFLSLEDFNHQNVINSITFSRLENDSVEAEFDSIFGIGGVIRCTSVEVSDVTMLL